MATHTVLYAADLCNRSALRMCLHRVASSAVKVQFCMTSSEPVWGCQGRNDSSGDQGSIKAASSGDQASGRVDYKAEGPCPLLTKEVRRLASVQICLKPNLQAYTSLQGPERHAASVWDRTRRQAALRTRHIVLA